MSDETVWDVALAAEQDRRARLKRRGKPLHYWQVRGDGAPPVNEYWCDHCVGFYGVPHGHHEDGICMSAYRVPRQCACIDCVVAEGLYAAVRVSPEGTE